MDRPAGANRLSVRLSSRCLTTEWGLLTLLLCAARESAFAQGGLRRCRAAPLCSFSSLGGSAPDRCHCRMQAVLQLAYPSARRTAQSVLATRDMLPSCAALPPVLGPSCSAHQVHKAQLRRFRPDQLRHLARREGGLSSSLSVRPGDTAWDICNSHGISLAELAAANRWAYAAKQLRGQYQVGVHAIRCFCRHKMTVEE